MGARRVFTVMPFGSRETPTGVVDFDAVYGQLVRPACVAAGFEVRRIDEIVTAGSITDHFLVELYEAEIVLADISLESANVYFELGIRQAISPGGTILIARTATPLPFDIADQRVFFYGTALADLDAGRNQLTSALRQHSPSQHTSRVRAFLERLGATTDPRQDAAAFERDLQGRIQRARNLDQLQAVWTWARDHRPLPLSCLLDLAAHLADFRAWSTSVQVMDRAVLEHPLDFEAQRQFGWHLRNAGRDDDAVHAFERALALNRSDPETLGMLGGLRKCQRRLEEALRLYEEGLGASPSSSYMRVNVAALRILLSPSDPERGVAEYEHLLRADSAGGAADVWNELVRGEACFAVGDDERATRHFELAVRAGAAPQHLRSVAEQLTLFADAGFRPAEARRLAEFLERDHGAPSARVPPAARPEPTAITPSPRGPVLLHISDLHFGSIVRDGIRREMHRFRDGEYDRPLHEHLREDFVSRNARFQVEKERLWLIVSGDLTYTAEQGEFDRVLECLEKVCHALDLPRSRVVVVPGNHDVHWPSCATDRTHRFDGFLSFAWRFYGEDLFRARFPLVRWDFRVDSQRPPPHDMVSLASDGDVTILGLNSCTFEDDKQHWGFIGGRQLRAASSLVEGVPVAPLRVAVFHHHLHPVPEPLDSAAATGIGLDSSTIRDAGMVERWLTKNGFDLLLHGHKHKPQIRETLVRDRNEGRRNPRPLIVCGTGSTGVDGKELEHHVPNHYSVLDVKRVPREPGATFVSIEWRELPLTPAAEWATADTWHILG